MAEEKAPKPLVPVQVVGRADGGAVVGRMVAPEGTKPEVVVVKLPADIAPATPAGNVSAAAGARLDGPGLPSGVKP